MEQVRRQQQLLSVAVPGMLLIVPCGAELPHCVFLQAPRDPILGVSEAFLADGNPHKINLGVVSWRQPLLRTILQPCPNQILHADCCSNVVLVCVNHGLPSGITPCHHSKSVCAK